MLPLALRLQPGMDVLENFYRCAECLAPARVAAFGQGLWKPFGCAKGDGKGFEWAEFPGVVEEIKALVRINGQVREWRGTVALVSGEIFDFDESKFAGDTMPSMGDEVKIMLKRIPGMIHQLTLVSVSMRAGDAPL